MGHENQDYSASSADLKSSPTNYAMGITDKKLAMQLDGASLSDAISMEVMGKVFGINSPNSPDMFTNTKPEDGLKEALGFDLPKVEDLLGPRVDLLSKYFPKAGEFDLNKLDEKPYEFGSQYGPYHKEKNVNQKGVKIYQEQDDPLKKKDDVSPAYSNDNSTFVDYEGSSTQASQLETIAYAINQAASYNPVDPRQDYMVANTVYSVLASEGYLGSGIGYLNLAVDDGISSQNYMVMVKYDKDKPVREDRSLVKELEGMLGRMTARGQIDQNDIVDTMARVMAKRDKNSNLFVQEEELTRLKAKLEKVTIKKGEDLVVLMEQEELEVFKRTGRSIVKLNNIQNNKKPYKKYLETVDVSPSFSELAYVKKLEDKRKDFTHNVPAKFVTKIPANSMGSVLGFTYLGENMMGIRDDLLGDEANEVEIHEAIHTDNEYETRQIVRWMLEGDTKYH